MEGLNRTRPGALLGALALLLLVGLPARAQTPAVAGCALDAVDVFPAAGSVVPTNARIVLEGFGSRAGQLRRLIGKTLVLSSGKTRVSMAVKSAFSAGDHRLAVELVPRIALEPGKEWQLDLGAVLPLVKLRDGRDASVLTWSTGRGADRTSPVVKRVPTVEQGRVVNGERQVTFRVDAVEEGPLLLVGKLRSAKGGPTRRYFVPVRGGRAILGDGACGGWSLESGRAYFVGFEALDVAGQTSRALDEIEFNAPRGGAE